MKVDICITRVTEHVYPFYKQVKNHFQILLLSTAVSCCSLSCYGASFDCKKASTDVEKMICADDELSRLDSELAAIYKMALITSKNAAEIKENQKRWLVNERNNCSDAICIKTAYEKRIKELNASNKFGGEHKIDGRWIIDPYFPGVAQDQPLCQGLQKRLNSFYWESSECSWNVLATYPEFSPPPWQKLDPREHVELIYKLLMFRRGQWRHLQGLAPEQDKGDRHLVSDFISSGGELYVWRTRLFNYYPGGNPAPPGMQTVVELRKNGDIDKSVCKGKPYQPWTGSTYVVTKDLSGLDSNLDWDTASDLQDGILKMYEGEPYLVYEYGKVYRMPTANELRNSWPMIIYCNFRYSRGIN